MHYRRFGRTNLSLSLFSLGTMRCLDSWEIFDATLRRGLDLGINHIETARGYGSSERWLGRWLQEQGRPQGLIFTTKIPPYPIAPPWPPTWKIPIVAWEANGLTAWLYTV
jgi:aryl-alcohol dehydrogenase-like predicted oxidoreductase